MGATRTATAAEKEALKNDLMLINSDLERAKDINEINAQVTKVANRLEKAGVMNIQQRDQFLREVNAITDAQKKKEYIRKGIRIGVYGAVGTGAATGAYNLITK
jgi:GMP synthase PP-ATPase subunit